MPLIPDENPMKKLISMDSTNPATPVAARAYSPAKWPTTMQSVMLNSS